VPRWLTWLALGTLALATLALTIPYPVISDDIWIHLKTAAYVWHHRAMPPIAGPDLYSFTARHPYVVHSWGGALIFWLAYSAAGIPGLVMLRSLVAGATYALVYTTMRRLSARLAVIVPLFALVLVITADRMNERPMIFTSLLTAVYVWIWRQSRRRGARPGGLNPRAWAYALPPLQLLWANLHGAAIQGVILVGCFALGESLRAQWDRQTMRRWGLVTVGCVLASCATPYGAGVLRFVLDTSQFRSPREWYPLYRSAALPTPEIRAYLLYVGVTCWAVTRRDADPRYTVVNRLLQGVMLLCGGIIVYGRLQPLGESTLERQMVLPWVAGMLAVACYTLIACLAVFFLVNRRTTDPVQALVILFALALSVWHVRCVADATLATVGFTTHALTAWRPQTSSRGFRQRRASLGWMGLGCALLWGMIVLQTGQMRLGLDERIPTCAMDFLMTNHITGRAWTTPSFAQWLVFHMPLGAVQVNIDTRSEVYDAALIGERMAASSDPDSMRAYLRRHRIDFFLIDDSTGIEDPIRDALLQDGWVIAHRDGVGMVLLPASHSAIRPIRCRS
jgi:hypothetical protein